MLYNRDIKRVNYRQNAMDLFKIVIEFVIYWQYCSSSSSIVVLAVSFSRILEKKPYDRLSFYVLQFVFKKLQRGNPADYI